jgi:hypothetical protein
MNIEEIRNAVYTKKGHIDCEILHPIFGWIPFTASVDDYEEHGRLVFEAMKDIAEPYDPSLYPEPTEQELLEIERSEMVVSRFQAKAAILQADLLPAVEAALADADPIARLAWSEAVEFRRDSPTIISLCAAIGLTDEQLDDLFRVAKTIKA